MEISDIRIRKILQEGRLRAVVSLTIDNAVAVHDIKLIQGDDRMFVAMPSRRDESGMFRDIVHPINPESRRILENRILTAYEQYLTDQGDGILTEFRANIENLAGKFRDDSINEKKYQSAELPQ